MISPFHPILSLLAWLAGWFILSGDTAKAAPPPTSGGPDAFGYVYTDSRATEVPPGFPDKPVYDWEEIGPGDQRGIKLPTVKDLANNAVGYGIISLGFPFRFYDNVYDFSGRRCGARPRAWHWAERGLRQGLRLQRHPLRGLAPRLARD